MDIHDYYSIVSQEGRKKFLIERSLEGLNLLATLVEEIKALRVALSAAQPPVVNKPTDIRRAPSEPRRY